ncbi:MAG TPA: TIGR04283 family arsenosugar biosynthesis glycosyltransferase [Leptolyngbyaceae cyanobacterium]
MNHNKNKISIIIPVLNEAKNIKQVLSNLPDSSNLEIIVVDGGSQDETVAIVRSLGIKILFSSGGRAMQMNTGAAMATGDIFLFLHADTILPTGFPAMVTNALAETGIIAGAFKLAIDAEIWGIGLIEKMVNWRSRFCSLPYGDQAIFLKADVFKQIGGFPQLPIMEDFVLIRHLKKLGKITILPVPAITSGRRWQKLGIVKTTSINQLMIIGYYLGISTEKLAHWYRNQK